MKNLQETSTWVNEIVDNAISTEKKNNNRSVVILLTKDKRDRR